MNKKSKLTIDIEMDENHIPEKINWESHDVKNKKSKSAKAALLSFWDEKELNALSVDIWTKNMSVEEMSKFYFQTFMTMADTFEKATSEDQMALAIRDFSEFFGEKLGVIPRTGKFDSNGEGQA